MYHLIKKWKVPASAFLPNSLYIVVTKSRFNVSGWHCGHQFAFCPRSFKVDTYCRLELHRHTRCSLAKLVKQKGVFYLLLQLLFEEPLSFRTIQVDEWAIKTTVLSKKAIKKYVMIEILKHRMTYSKRCDKFKMAFIETKKQCAWWSIDRWWASQCRVEYDIVPRTENSI